MENMDWRVRAACRDEDAELFFPVSYRSPKVRAQVAEAKTVCVGCAVRETCAAWAIETGQPEGIWGGLTPEERPRPKARKGGKPKPTVDEVVVDRVIAGKPVGRKLHKEERVAVADTMLASGRTITAAAMAVGCSNTTMRGLVA